MTVLVTGSRGHVGSALISALHAAGVPVRAASRVPGQLTPPPGVPTVACDLDDPDTFAPALDSVESVFLYASPAHTPAFVAAAHAAGVRHIVLLSSASLSWAERDGAPDGAIATLHRAAETALAAAVDGTGVETTVLRPGDFATNALQWAGSLRATGSIAVPYPGSHSSPIDQRDIADCAFTVLTGRPEARNATHVLTGPQSLPVSERVALLAEATGRPFSVEQTTPEAWKAAIAPFTPASFADDLLGYLVAGDGKPAEVTDTVERLTGHPARTFAQWARDHIEAFTPDGR